MDIIKHTS